MTRGRHRLAAWAEPLLRERTRFKCLYGGRASGKTWQIAAALVLLGVRGKLRVACVRETQKSIRESAKSALEGWVERFGLQGFYRIQRDYIVGANGTVFFFAGMTTSTEEAIRGWEGVDRTWIEEAHMMSQKSRDILYPTVLRKPGSEIWASFNPRYRSDPAYRDFVLQPVPGLWARKVNYADNPWFPPEADELRRHMERTEPERYAHVWLGEPDDEGQARKVLPYGLLRQCVEAWAPERASGPLHAGLDVADSAAGGWNALAARRGPCLVRVERWRAPTTAATARRADAWCRASGAAALHYDAGGVGAGVRSALAELGPRGYSARGVNFGASPAGPNVQYAFGQTNLDFFTRRNGQLAWALRLRAQATRRIVRGDSVDPSRGLFIDPAIPGLELLLAELQQPQWKESELGKLLVDKTPEDEPSPDMYDAVALAFGADSRYGLRVRP